MKLVGAVFGRDHQLAAAARTVFGGIIGYHHLHFANRIYAGREVAIVPKGAAILASYAVQLNEHLACLTAVDGRHPRIPTRHVMVIEVDHAGQTFHHPKPIAASHRRIRDLRTIDLDRAIGAVCRYVCAFRGYGYRRGDIADSKPDIVQGHFLIQADADRLLDVSFETFTRNADRVTAGHQVHKEKVAISLRQH